MILKKNVALVVGGAGGIGAAAVERLLERGYNKVYIADRAESKHHDDRTEFLRFNLVSDDPETLVKLCDIDTLIITAGVGRLDYFETNSQAEIENVFRINTLSAIEIIKAFYVKLCLAEDFYCTVMSSIAGLVSSPLYAVYAASKAALSRFAESINAELAGKGFNNRILTVAPGRIDGTGFHGGKDKPEMSLSLADEIVEKMLNRETLFIPNYKVYGDVLRRYRENADLFGLESFKYKTEKNSLETKKRLKIGYLTGTFDLFHIGHLNLLRRAKQYCDYLVVGVHTDGSHKGKQLFIPLEERMAIVSACKYVDRVIECSKEDIDAYEELKYDYLFVGSDYKGTERFNRYERELNPKGVKIIYFPYTKGTSSTQLRGALDSLSTDKK